MNESGICVGVRVKCKDFVLSTELIRYIDRQIRKKIEKLKFHPKLSKLLAIQEHAQNLEEQL